MCVLLRDVIDPGDTHSELYFELDNGLLVLEVKGVKNNHPVIPQNLRVRDCRISVKECEELV